MAVKKKRKHGRMRRWVVRPFFWAVAGVVVAIFLCLVVAESAFVRERLRRQVVERLESYLGRPVVVEEVGLELWPLSIELRGVEISSLDERPFLELERLVVDARSIRLRGPAVRLGRVRIERPIVRLFFREDGTDNLPRRARPRTEPARGPPSVELSIGELSLIEGALELDQRRLPLSLEARDLQASLLGGSEPRLQGRLDAEELKLVLPRAEPFLGSVALRVDLDAEGLGIVSGQVRGPQLAVEVEGHVGWRGEREVSLDVVASGDASILDQLGYARGQFRGRFAFDGGWLWRPRLWGYRGTLTSADLEAFGRRLIDLEAVVAGDRNGARADIERATYGGGQLRGQIIYEHKVEGRPLALELDLDGVSLARLLADQRLPLRGIDARVSGPFSYSFPIREPTRGSGLADLRFEPGGPSIGALQLAGTAPLSFSDGELRSEAILAVSESQHVLAIGSYDIPSRRGRFDLEIGSERIEELLTLLPIEPETLRAAAWAPRSGSGRVSGSLHLAPEGTRSEILLDLRNVEAEGYRAERAQGAFNVGQAGIDGLRFELLEPAAAVIVSGSIPFGEEDGLPFSLAVDAAGWPASEARAWLPFEPGLEGPISGSLTLSGDPGALEGTLEARLEPASISGVEVDRLELGLEFDPSSVRFVDATATAPSGELRLSGLLGLETGALDLRVESGPLDLARPPLAALLPAPVGGSARLSGNIGGRLERPEASGELFWSDVTLEDRPLAAAQSSTLFDWDGSRLELAGGFPGLDRFAGGGRVDDRGYRVEIELATGDLSGIAAALSPEGLPQLAQLDGDLAGTLVARGEHADPASREVALRLDRLSLVHEAVSLHAAEPVELRLGNGSLWVDSLFLTTDDEASELFVAGSVDLGEERRLDFNAQSSLESEWFGLLLPDAELRDGRFEMLASIGGTYDRPLVNGVGNLEGASALFTALPVALEELEGLILFYPERLVIDSLQARAGSGTVEAVGFVSLGGSPGGGFEPNYQLDMRARDLSLPYPEGWLVRGDAQASLVSTSAGRVLRGEVELERAYYLQEIRVGFESALQALFERRRQEVEVTSELRSSTALDLRIQGEDALRIRNNVARVGGDVDFTLRGTLADPVLFGSVEIAPGGTLVYAGNEYEVERGELNFANPYRIEPIVDLVAVTDLRDYDVRLGLSGSPQRLDVRVSSNPPLPELEALALLTGGSAPERLTLDDRLVDESGVGAESFLAGQAASAVTDRVNRLFGLDRLRVSPLTSGSGDLSSARVTLGERISRDLFVTYSYDPSTTEEQILEIEWSVSQSLLVVLTQNGDESYSLDVRWEKAF
jgi:hypothetical protein